MALRLVLLASMVPLARPFLGQCWARSGLRQGRQVGWASRGQARPAAPPEAAARAQHHQSQAEDLRHAIREGRVRPVKVSVDTKLRQHFRLSKKQKSGRVFVPSEVLESVHGLREALKRQVGLPESLEVSLATAQDGTEGGRELAHISDAQQLRQVLEGAGGQGVPPRLVLAYNGTLGDTSRGGARVRAAAADLPDPAEAESMQMLSFFLFEPVPDAEGLAGELRCLWDDLHIQGRVYTAPEGINAQVAVPSNMMPHFRDACRSHWYLRDVDLNLDVAVPFGEYRRRPPFQALHVRPRRVVVADGFQDEAANVDLTGEAGARLTPAEWHEAIDDPAAVVLDCRNHYESDLGRFTGATPLDTETYRETWEALEEKLQGVPRDQPVLTYCTGGIRCVKVGAYLTQKLGFERVGRLEGGIVNYTSFVQQLSTDEGRPVSEVSKYQGLNYVFNDRMAEVVTQAIPNPGGSSRRVAEAIAVAQERMAEDVGGASPTVEAVATGDTGVEGGASAVESIEAYAADQCGSEDDLLQELRFATMAAMPKAAHMVSGHLQGTLLELVCRMVNARAVLELGTFTGYATLRLAAAVDENDGRVTTVEVDPNAAAFAQSFFARSGLEQRIQVHVGNAQEVIHDPARIQGVYDVVFIDADKRKYTEYYDTLFARNLVAPGSIIIVDNVLWKGRVVGMAKAGPVPDSQDEDRASRRDRVLTQAMHEFNVKVRKDRRVEQVLLPLRDGLSVIRVK